MSGQFPSNIEFSNVKLISIENNVTSRSISGKRYSRLIGGHKWALEVDVNFMNKVEFALVWSFLMKQKGTHETFTITIPGHDVSDGALSGTPVYLSTVDDNEIVTTGWNINTTDQVKAFDVFTIAGDSKVYQVTDNLDSDGSGNGNLVFYPALRKTPGTSAALSFTNVSFTVALTENPYYTRDGVFYKLSTLRLEEAL